MLDRSSLFKLPHSVSQANEVWLELRCTFGGRSIVPDISVFAWERIPVEANGDVAHIFPTHPDWTIEILSPDQSLTKVTGNILHCLKNGCQMGWLVDPSDRSVLVFPPE
jgi:Uma2 family endonuclease